jgi:hypothetical protein
LIGEKRERFFQAVQVVLIGPLIETHMLESGHYNYKSSSSTTTSSTTTTTSTTTTSPLLQGGEMQDSSNTKAGEKEKEIDQCQKLSKYLSVYLREYAEDTLPYYQLMGVTALTIAESAISKKMKEMVGLVPEGGSGK